MLRCGAEMEIRLVLSSVRLSGFSEYSLQARVGASAPGTCRKYALCDLEGICVGLEGTCFMCGAGMAEVAHARVLQTWDLWAVRCNNNAPTPHWHPRITPYIVSEVNTVHVRTRRFSNVKIKFLQ